MDPSSADGATLKGKTVLAVFAHPDDESLACGGTLARLADAGVRVVLFCASRGGLGRLNMCEDIEELARTRVQELENASAELGIAEMILMDHPDGRLRWEDVPELEAEIVAAVRQCAPECVITFGEDGLYWHPDHIAVYERTTAALRSLSSEAPPLYCVTMIRGTMRRIVEAAKARGWTTPPKGFWSLEPDAVGLHAEPPTIVVNVVPWVQRKLAALRCHRTQMGQGPFELLGPEEAERWLGIEHFHRAPEAGHDASQPSVLDSIGAPFQLSETDNSNAH